MSDEIPAYAREMINLASERFGARALAASDEFFAPKERMLQDSDPVFIADKYVETGKWMDGWESRRKRGPGHDWCIVELGAPGVISGVLIDTSHFTGNYPPQASIESCMSLQRPDEATQWQELTGKLTLKGDSRHFFQITSQEVFSHLRLNIYPDGGIARFRVYGRAVSRPQERRVDLAAARFGGHAIAWSDAHYGNPQYILYPGHAANMGDGWETRRRRGPGHDWIVVELGQRGEIDQITVDTAHFKGNYPDRCFLEAVDAGSDGHAFEAAKAKWTLLLGEEKLDMDREHVFGGDKVHKIGPVTHVRVNIIPDGGIARLRLVGRTVPAE